MTTNTHPYIKALEAIKAKNSHSLINSTVDQAIELFKQHMGGDVKTYDLGHIPITVYDEATAKQAAEYVEKAALAAMSLGEVPLETSDGEQTAAVASPANSLGHRALYADGTVSREYDEQPVMEDASTCKDEVTTLGSDAKSSAYIAYCKAMGLNPEHNNLVLEEAIRQAVAAETHGLMSAEVYNNLVEKYCKLKKLYYGEEAATEPKAVSLREENTKESL